MENGGSTETNQDDVMNKAKKSKPYRSHDEATAEMFRRDPAFAAEYLNHVLEQGDKTDLMLALRHIGVQLKRTHKSVV